MARPRTFELEEVISLSRTVFALKGYNGTSIDDLVEATGLLRGSLYKAFGSKRNLFLEILLSALKDFEADPQNIDLLTVAMKELAPIDSEIQHLCRAFVAESELDFALLLGNNLLAKLRERE